MIYIGIVERNETVVLAIKTYLLDRRDCFIVFDCPAAEVYNSLPDESKTIDILFMGVSDEEEELQLAGRIRKQQRDTQVVFMMSTNNERIVLKAIKMGVTGFLKKPFSQRLLDECIVNIASGKSFLSFDVQRKVFDLVYQEQLGVGRKVGPHSLTERESDIIRLLLKGCTNKEIGDALFISHHTVNEHLKRMFRKLNVNSRIKLVYKIVADFNLYD